MIFRELINAIKEVKIHLATNNSLDSGQLYLRKLHALGEIKEYVEGLSYLKHQRSKNRIKIFFTSGCDYKKTAENLKVKPHVIVVSVNRVSKIVEEKIGSNTIEKILNAVIEEDIHYAMKRFYTGKKKEFSEKLFVLGFKQLLPIPKYDKSFSLTECERELRVLKNISTFEAKRFIELVDKNKLAHLLGLLESQEPSTDKEIVLSLIKGDFAVVDNKRVSINGQVEKAIDISKNIFYQEG